MRLIRRAVACLLVGLTAFGVAGWLLRPKPHWTVSIGTAKGASFGGHPAPQLTGGPLWVSVRDKEDHLPADRWLCLDARTGAQLKSVPTPHKTAREAWVLKTGRLMVVSTQKSEGGAVETLIEMHDHEHEGPVHSRRLVGDFELTRGATYAWQVRETPNGLALKVIDVATGAVAFTKTFPGGRYVLGTWTLTDDGRFALDLGDPMEDSVPTGVEVWDLRKDALIASATFPPLAHLAKVVWVSRPYFDDAERSVVMDVVKKGSHDPFNTHLRWLTLYLDTGILNDDPLQVLSDPPNAGEGTIVACNDPGWDRYQLWISEQPEPLSTWWCLQRDGKVLVPWRKWNFPTQRGGFGVHGHPMGVHVSVRPRFLATPNEILFETNEEGSASLIPSTFRAWVPKALRMPWTVRRFRWHDWTTGEWRDVPFDFYYGQLDWSDDALLVSTVEDGRLLLQSWPWPPREVKRPALATALVCMTLTGWLFARRVQRRAALAQKET